jgi:hypothetical protein
MKAVPAICWFHVSGRRASSGGAAPWHTEAERREWTLQTDPAIVGWTIQHDDGTRGIGRVPFRTEAEALAWMAAHPRFSGMGAY